MKIRKCKECGNYPARMNDNGSIVIFCVNTLCKRCGSIFDKYQWDNINKPDKQSKKDREIARLTEIVEMSKADLAKDAEKIASLTRTVDAQKEYSQKTLMRVAELTRKLAELSSENVILHNKLISAVGVDEAFDA